MMALELVQSIGLCENHVSNIKRCISNIAISFVEVGFYLYEVKVSKLFQELGYKNIEEFGLKELNLKSSSIYNFINCCVVYSSKNNGFPSRNLDSKYLGFGYTQLTQMLSLSDIQKESVKVDMTIKEIKEIKNKSLVVAPKEVIQSLEIIDRKVPDFIHENQVSIIHDLNESRNYLIDINDKLTQETRRLALLVADHKLNLVIYDNNKIFQLLKDKAAYYKKINRLTWYKELEQLILDIKNQLDQ